MVPSVKLSSNVSIRSYTTAQPEAQPKKDSAKLDDEFQGVLERGYIRFFYTLKVGLKEGRRLNDVAKLYFQMVPQKDPILKPDFSNLDSTKDSRLIFVSKKRLSDTAHLNWAFVDRVNEKLEDLEFYNDLRPIGEGVYTIVEKKTYTELAFVLEEDTPEKDYEKLQQVLNIEKEASYVIAAKNPEGGRSLKPYRAYYPEHIQALFEGKKKKMKWIPLQTLELLDFKGAEIVLIGKNEFAVEELEEVTDNRLFTDYPIKPPSDYQ